MAIRAKRNFTDKNTNQLYKEGEIIEVEKSIEDRYLKSPYNVAELVKKTEEVEEDARVQAKTNKKSKNNT